jgi:hypothetical protein
MLKGGNFAFFKKSILYISLFTVVTYFMSGTVAIVASTVYALVVNQCVMHNGDMHIKGGIITNWCIDGCYGLSLPN